MITNVEGISSICCINRKFFVRYSCRRFYCIFMKIEGNTLNVTSQHREGYGTVKCLQTPVQLFTQQLQLHSCSSYTHPSLAVPPTTGGNEDISKTHQCFFSQMLRPVIFPAGERILSSFSRKLVNFFYVNRFTLSSQ